MKLARGWRMVVGGGAAIALLLALGLTAGLSIARNPAPAGAPAIPRLLEQAHVLLDRGDLPGARSLYRQVLARDPSSVEALTHLGNIAYAEGDVDRALDFYDRALALDPRDAHTLYDKGVALRHGRQDFRGAVAAWRRFLEVMTDGPDATRVRGWIEEAERLAAASPVSRRPEGSRLRRTLSPGRFTGKVARVYAIASEIPHVLERLPCYCGCDRSSGHANLLDCFADDHAVT